MPAISPEMRQRLLAQKKAINSGGMVLKNKNITRLLFHLMPARDGEVIGTKYISVFHRVLKKSSTCPRVFGLACPVMDYVDHVKLTGSKEERDSIYKLIDAAAEFWLLGLDPEDIGTAANPNFRIWRSKQRIYDQIISHMLDETDGGDITDLRNGGPVLIKKEGQQLDTRWTINFQAAKPIFPTEEEIQEVEAALANIDITQRFFKVNWDNLAIIYKDITGETMPDEYRHQEGADKGSDGDPDEADDHASSTVAKPKPPAPGLPKPAAAPPKPAAPAAAKAPIKPAAMKKAPPPPPEPAAEAAPEADANGVILGVTEATFKDADGNDVVGLLTAWNGEAYDFVAPPGSVGEGEWTVKPGEFTILESAEEAAAREAAEAEAAAAAEAEAAAAAAAAAPKGPARRPAAPKPAAPATAPAKEAAKVPAKPAPPKLPAKPAATAPGKATASLRSRVSPPKA